VTEINTITCNEARELFSPFIDNCLSAKENEILNGHLSLCSACRDELNEWRAISSTLSQMQPMACPDPDFSQAIINTIKTREKTQFKFAAFGIKKQFAAAAAAALIMFGSLGINAGIKVANNDTDLNDLKPSKNVEIADNKNVGTDNTPNEDNSAVHNSADTSKSETPPEKSGTAEETAEQTPRENSPLEQTLNDNARTESGTAGESTPIALLSQNLVIESSVIKVSVYNPTASRALAQEVAVSNSGKANVMSTQGNTGQDTQIIQITVPHRQKDKLVNSLAGLGTVIDKNDDRVDITAKYNELQVQYNELLVNNAPGQGLDDRLSAIKQQLNSWEQEANNYTVLLLLVNEN